MDRQRRPQHAETITQPALSVVERLVGSGGHGRNQDAATARKPPFSAW
jgi:hypothetical protein